MRLLMVLCKCACAHLIWKANFNLISKPGLFMSFHIVFQITFQISFQILQDKNIAMFRLYGQKFWSILYMDSPIPFLYMYLKVRKFTDRSLIYRLQISFLFKFTSLSRLFHSYRDRPIGRWAEKIVPQENHLTHPQAELGLSHT